LLCLSLLALFYLSCLFNCFDSFGLDYFMWLCGMLFVLLVLSVLVYVLFVLCSLCCVDWFTFYISLVCELCQRRCVWEGVKSKELCLKPNSQISLSILCLFVLCYCFHFVSPCGGFGFILVVGVCVIIVLCVFVSYYIQVHVLHSQFNSYFFVIIRLNYVDVRLCFCLQYYGQFVLFCSSHCLFHFIGFVICMWCVCSHHVNVDALLCFV